jgi:hypothetical protein
MIGIAVTLVAYVHGRNDAVTETRVRALYVALHASFSVAVVSRVSTLRR